MLAVVAVGLFAVSMAWPFLLVIDDASFYLVIGRNVVAGHGLTFSQVMPTNGFQPLWQGAVTGIIWMCTLAGLTGPSLQLRVVIAVTWLLLAIGMVMVNRLLRELGARPTGRFVALLLILAFLGGPGFTLATEASLVLVTAAAALGAARHLVAATGPQVLAAGATGMLIGLLMLSRLDTVFLALTIVGALLVLGRHRPVTTRIGQASIATLVAMAVVTPYLAWNLAEFGRVMPIAGAIKVDASRFAFSPEAVGIAAFVLLGVAVTAGIAAFTGRARGEAWSWWLVTFIGASLASLFYYCFAAIAWTGGGWYQVPQLLAAALAVAPAVDRLLESPKRLVRQLLVGAQVAFVALIAFVEVRFYLIGSYRPETEAVVRFGDRIRDEVGPGGVVAVADFPGVLALTSERRMIAIDGLTGDFAFQEQLRDVGPSCTFAERGIRYIVARDGPGLEPGSGTRATFTLLAGSSLYPQEGDRLTLDATDLLLFEPVNGLRLFRYTPRCNDDHAVVGSSTPDGDH